MDRQRRLLGLGQTVEVGQHRGAAVAQVIIELTAGAQLEQVQGQPPPGQEACGVGASLRDARVGETVEPGVELGEEVADGLDEGPAGDYGRPALSFSNRARARSRATDS